ncbi:MAG TPA: phosphoribosylanthranilate isomerase [Candidatus Eisenbacteria bacterium]|nr:phosphoribosylanthranilate isomerase [Candidatus Eisenbacteria bacterium]
MSVVVKICGVCTPEDARAAVDAGADLLGLNFVPSSPRYLVPDAARRVAAAATVPLVGVFVDAPREEVLRIAAHVGLAGLQFHGDEPPAYCRGWTQQTIKALRPRPGEDAAARAADYDTDFILLDTWVPGVAGGTGVALDPAAACGLPRDRLFVAGGLRPETVADVVRALRPHGVDVASGVERRPGVKDHDKIREFIRRAKAA